MVGNIIFLMMFAVFDPSPLTQWINCYFLVLIAISGVGAAAVRRQVRPIELSSLRRATLARCVVDNNAAAF